MLSLTTPVMRRLPLSRRQKANQCTMALPKQGVPDGVEKETYFCTGSLVQGASSWLQP